MIYKSKIIGIPGSSICDFGPQIVHLNLSPIPLAKNVNYCLKLFQSHLVSGVDVKYPVGESTAFEPHGSLISFRIEAKPTFERGTNKTEINFVFRVDDDDNEEIMNEHKITVWKHRHQDCICQCQGVENQRTFMMQTDGVSKNVKSIPRKESLPFKNCFKKSAEELSNVFDLKFCLTLTIVYCLQLFCSNKDS